MINMTIFGLYGLEQLRRLFRENTLFYFISLTFLKFTKSVSDSDYNESVLNILSCISAKFHSTDMKQNNATFILILAAAG